MKILFLTNNNVSYPLYEWLKNEAKEDISFYSEKLSIDYITKEKPDLLISYNYRHIINQEILEHINYKAVNLHISLLPWNRGANPNFWSFIEDSAKGVSIHLIDAGIDTGDILLQKEITFDEQNETLGSTYNILHKEIQTLFINNWTRLKHLQIKSIKQENTGNFHLAKEFDKIKEILGNDIFNIPINTLKERYKEIRN